jgi:hypothetical protein
MLSFFWSVQRRMLVYGSGRVEMDVEEVNATMKDINEAYIVSRPIFEARTLRML